MIIGIERGGRGGRCGSGGRGGKGGMCEGIGDWGKEWKMK